MLRTGDEYLASLRDGRQVYVGGKLIDDVTIYDGFSGSAKTVARLFDRTASDPALTYVEPETGEKTSLNFLRPRSREDLTARRALHTAWAEVSNGLFGRSPDHVAAMVTGMACRPEVTGNEQYAENLLNYWRHIRDNDLYLSFAVLPPAGSKSGKSSAVQNAMRVIATGDEGVTVRGYKMLATGGALCHEILVGNAQPLRAGDESVAVSFGIAANHPGVKILSRKPYAAHAVSNIDDPLADFDESDAAIYFDDVVVPWNRIFVLDDWRASYGLFVNTPAHTLGNSQAHIRLLAKMRFMLAAAKRLGDALDFTSNPAVQGVFGGLAARVKMLEASVLAQEFQPERWDHGYVSQDRQFMYASSNWSMEYFSEFSTEMRRMLASHAFQQPADVSAFEDDYTRRLFLELNRTDDFEVALGNYRLIRLMWGLVGSELASRNNQYELFYAGPPHVTRSRMYDCFDWASAEQRVDEFLAQNATTAADAQTTR
ncbi:4-hydroxyphenylacetate 3-hydroxylase N-terminal domain-containing protein [Rhodococcus opacus]|uniref:4-hydroxyphenylacetate 3-hydroxylase N-terminal domain-containing protein n=1 Tax=Rhodococcus opacus TaxID=37919 RepID=UPI0024BA04F8|nr:4-hydroxyphenylacetate 3-hydroxylase N-terminal domain-containing protein [Rhodococcus opacus]MDJ0414328.1 4-hydroxyphenylacetate 3-hydroxylase N-terminal domain-containing protein [Rhodococcus opacus]